LREPKANNGIEIQSLIGYLDSVRSVQPANRWKILVLDEQTQAHIGSVLKMYDILEEGVQRKSSASLTAEACSLVIVCLFYQNSEALATLY